MEKEKPSYFSIIPASVRYNNNISASEKIFYSEITALTKQDGFCYASNDYFSKLYNCSSRCVQKWLDNLKKEKLIIVEVDKSKGNKRKIYLIENFVLQQVNKKKQKKYKNDSSSLGKFEKENLEKNIMEGMEIL